MNTGELAHYEALFLDLHNLQIHLFCVLEVKLMLSVLQIRKGKRVNLEIMFNITTS